jgi:hypothetical protein
MLPVSMEPDKVSESWASRLTTIFGDESWRNLYKKTQTDLFGLTGIERECGVDGLLNIYKDKLSN